MQQICLYFELCGYINDILSQLVFTTNFGSLLPDAFVGTLALLDWMTVHIFPAHLYPISFLAADSFC